MEKKRNTVVAREKPVNGKMRAKERLNYFLD